MARNLLPYLSFISLSLSLSRTFLSPRPQAHSSFSQRWSQQGPALVLFEPGHSPLPPSTALLPVKPSQVTGIFASFGPVFIRNFQRRFSLDSPSFPAVEVLRPCIRSRQGPLRVKQRGTTYPGCGVVCVRRTGFSGVQALSISVSSRIGCFRTLSLCRDSFIFPFQWDFVYVVFEFLRYALYRPLRVEVWEMFNLQGRIMHPRRPRTRGGRVPRWGANPPSPSPSPSPPLSPPSPPIEGHDGGNGCGLRRLLSQFTRTVSTALQGRRNTEGLDIKMCPDGDKVRLAAFLLKGNAYHWWKTVCRGYTNPATITWEEFQKAFFDQFYPHSYKTAKRVEFLHLRQGSMSVFEYEHKFNELSQFAPELVTTKEDKCTRFEEGLWLDIQAVVTATTYPTMRALAQAADRMANTYSLGAGIGRRGRDLAGFGGPSQGPSKRGGSSSSSASSGWSGGRGSSSGSRRSGSQSAWSQHSGQQSVGSTARDPQRQFSVTCYKCGQAGHVRKECPNRDWGPAGSRAQGQTQSGASSSAASSSLSSGVKSTFQGRSGRGQRGQSGHSTTQARVFSMTQQEVQATPDVITGMIPIFGYFARVLIDPGATHSFIAHSFLPYASVRPTSMAGSFSISLPTGDVLFADMVFKGCYVQVGDAMLEVNLIPLELVDLDIILGMDWLEKHRASVDCFRKEVVLRSPGQLEVIFHGECRVLPSCLISAIRAKRLLKKGYVGYLAHIINTQGFTLNLEDVPVVCEFPDDLPGLPPQRETEFTIELLRGPNPIH
ncbi:unnamed protein product [Prunus armeniaca]